MAVVEYRVENHIAIITLNRPEARNAINPEVAVRLAQAWEQVRKDDDVRVAIVPADELLAKSIEIAQKIVGNGPLAVKAIRQSAQACLGRPEEDALRMELEFADPVFQTEDAQEGPRAFMEKRPPVYRGQ